MSPLDELEPRFTAMRSTENKIFLYAFCVLIALWLIEIFYQLFLIISQLVHQSETTDPFGNGVLFVIGSLLVLGSLILVTKKKEPFYTHLIINEEGITYFDNYHFRPRKIIHWTQLVSSPLKSNNNQRDILYHPFFVGTSEIMFWYEDHEKLLLHKENFGGYGWIPLVYNNKKCLKCAFITGILTYRKDLRVDPKLMRYKVYAI